jgi:hypothetical protein
VASKTLSVAANVDAAAHDVDLGASDQVVFPTLQEGESWDIPVYVDSGSDALTSFDLTVKIPAEYFNMTSCSSFDSRSCGDDYADNCWPSWGFFCSQLPLRDGFRMIGQPPAGVVSDVQGRIRIATIRVLAAQATNGSVQVDGYLSALEAGDVAISAQTPFFAGSGLVAVDAVGASRRTTALARPEPRKLSSEDCSALTGAELADTNGDGQINTLDSAFLLRKYLVEDDCCDITYNGGTNLNDFNLLSNSMVTGLLLFAKDTTEFNTVDGVTLQISVSMKCPGCVAQAGCASHAAAFADTDVRLLLDTKENWDVEAASQTGTVVNSKKWGCLDTTAEHVGDGKYITALQKQTGGLIIAENDVPLAVHQFKGSRRWGWFDDSGADATADVALGTCVVNPVATLAVAGHTVTTTATTNTLANIYLKLEGEFTIEVDETKREEFVTDPDVNAALTAAIANISEIPESVITVTLLLKPPATDGRLLKPPATDGRRLSSSVTLVPVYAKYVIVGFSGVVARGFAKLQQTTETVLSEYVTHHLEKAGLDYPSAIVSYHRVGDAVSLGRDPDRGIETATAEVPIRASRPANLAANTIVVLIAVVAVVVCCICGAVGYKVLRAVEAEEPKEETGQQAFGPSEEDIAQREDIVVEIEGGEDLEDILWNVDDKGAPSPAAGSPRRDWGEDPTDAPLGLPPMFLHDEPAMQRRTAMDVVTLEKDMKSRFRALEAEQPSTAREEDNEVIL